MRYDPILCMMVDDTVKTKDTKTTARMTDKSYGKYKLPNGDIVEVIDRKNVNGVDSFVYKNKSGVHFATADWFMNNAVKVRDSKTIDSSEYDKWLKQNETEASNENLVKYLIEVKGFTKENAMKYAKGKTHDSLSEAIRNCEVK